MCISSKFIYACVVIVAYDKVNVKVGEVSSSPSKGQSIDVGVITSDLPCITDEILYYVSLVANPRSISRLELLELHIYKADALHITRLSLKLP